MSLEANKVIVRKITEAVNTQNLSLLDELMAPDYIDHTYQSQNREASKQVFTRLYTGIPDWHSTIEDIIAEGDKVWVRFTGTGTHKGDFRGLAPTGKKVTFKGVQIWRLIDGKVVSKDSILDLLDALRQLGAIEYTEKARALLP